MPPVLRANRSCVRTTASIALRRFLDVPVEMQQAILERQHAVGGITRLREPRHDPVERIQPQQHAQALYEGPRAGIDGPLRRELADEPNGEIGQSAILDEELLAVDRAVEQVDRRGDRRTARRFHLAHRMERRRQEVAVAAPVAAKERADVRQAAMHVAALQQKLGRPQRARGENHDAACDAAGGQPAAGNAIVVHRVAPGAGDDVPDQVQGAHVGMVASRRAECNSRSSVFRALTRHPISHSPRCTHVPCSWPCALRLILAWVSAWGSGRS